MSAPFANTVGLLKKYRYAVLGTTMLSALALPQWGITAGNARDKDGAIVVAQGNETPEQKRAREQKGKQQPQQQQQPPKGAPPPPPQTNRPPPPPPTQNVQPKVLPKSNPVLGQPSGNPQGQQNDPRFRKDGQPKGGQPNQQGQNQPNPQGQQNDPRFRKEGQPKGGQPKNAPVVGQPGGQPQVTPQGQPNSDPRFRKEGQPKGGQPQLNPQAQPGFDPRVNPKGGPVIGGPKGAFPKGPGFAPGSQPVPANVDALRDQRRERRDPSGRILLVEPGGREIVRDRGQVFIRHNDMERFGRFGQPMVTRRGAETFAVVRRPGGYEIISVTDANGNLVRRIRRGPDGREVILIDNRSRLGGRLGVGAAVVGAGLLLGLAVPVITMPRERYIVDVDSAPPSLLVDTLMAPPVMAMERPYSLDEVRYNAPLRDRMPRIDINTITFASGSWEVTPDQYQALEAVAQAILTVLQREPNEVFMIEGYTDGVGNPDDNLSLSDRRAESVANILSETYMVPPENLVTQGYGDQYPKVPTQEANRENRRVAVRRIGPLMGQTQ